MKRRRPQPIPRLAIILFLLMGAVNLGVGLYIARTPLTLMAMGTKSEATIVGSETRKPRYKGPTIRYPIVSISAPNDEEMRVLSINGSNLPVGTIVPIIFQSDAPEDIYLYAEKSFETSYHQQPAIFGAMGAFFLWTGIALRRSNARPEIQAK